MKVLQALHFFLPRHGAGTEIYTDRLSRELLQRHEVAVFFAEKTLAQPNYRCVERVQRGLRCHVVVNNLLYSGFRETYDNPQIERCFEQVLDRERPDLLHVQHLMNLSLGVVRKAKERGIPVVMTLHDFWLFCARMGQLLEHGATLCKGPEAERCSRCLQSFKFAQSKGQARVIRALAWTQDRLNVPLGSWADATRGRLHLPGASRGKPPAGARPPQPLRDPLPGTMEERSSVVRRVIEDVDLFIAPSRTMLENSVAFGLPAARVRQLQNGCPVSVAASITRVPRRDRVRFGFLGTPAPHKGLHVLIEAFHRMPSTMALLEVFGGPNRSQMRYYHALREAAAGLPVEFRGPMPNHRIHEVFSAIDVLVVPSTWLENAPVVIQEARSFQVPVIASRLGGMAEAIDDGVDGLLFEPGDADDLAHKLMDLCSHPQRIDEMAKASRPPMTMPEHVRTLERWYSELTGR